MIEQRAAGRSILEEARMTLTERLMTAIGLTLLVVTLVMAGNRSVLLGLLA